jgi:hypothetical protein
MEIAKSAFSSAWESITGVFTDAWEGLKGILRSGMASIVDVFLGGVEWIVKGAASAFSWVPGVGPKLREAAEKFEGFRDEANTALRGVEGITVPISADTHRFWAELNAVQSAARNANAVYLQTEGVESSGPQRFATGLDMGPVRGPRGQAVPIIAHGGEWVLTPDQFAGMGAGMGGSAAGVDLLADRIVAALRSGPQPVLKVDRRVLGEVVAQEFQATARARS